VRPPTIAKRGISPAEIKRALPPKAKRAAKMPRPHLQKPRTHASEYMKLQLERWADKIVGIVPSSLPPHNSSKPDLSRPTSPMRELALSDFERLQIANYLRRLAQTPAAMEAMVTTAKGRGRPATNRARNDMAALDYVETLKRLKVTKMGKAYDAQAEVCAAWGMSRTALMEAYKACAMSLHWKEWAEIYRKQFALDHPELKPAQLLAEISKALRTPDHRT